MRTGLGLVEAMGGLNARLQAEQAVRLAVRVGVHTGLVVVGEMEEGRGVKRWRSGRPRTWQPGCRGWPSRIRSS